MSGLTTMLKAGTQIIVAVVLTLLALEGIVRTTFWSPWSGILERRDDLPYRTPGSSLIFSREGYSKGRVNSFGMRDDEPAAQKTGLRVLILGDSIAESVGTPLEATHHKLVEAELPNVEMINAGRSGTSPRHYVYFAQQHVAELAPDLLLVQISVQDVRDLENAAHPRLARSDAGWHLEHEAPNEARQKLRQVLGPVLRRSALLSALSHRIQVMVSKERDRLKAHFRTKAVGPKSGPNRIWSAEEKARATRDALGPLPPALHDGPVDVVDRELDQLHRALVRAAKTPIVYLFTPNFHEARGPCATSRSDRARFWRFSKRNAVELIDSTPHLCEQRLRTGQPVQGFSNSAIGTGHFNEIGNRGIANAVVVALRRRLP